MKREVESRNPLWCSRACNIALGIVIACAAISAAFLPLALTTRATGTFRTADLIVDNHYAIGAANTQSTINGPTLQSFAIPSTAYAFGEVNREEITGVVPAFPADLFTHVIRTTVSSDTTAHSQHAGSLAVESACTRSAGANDLQCTGAEFSASGGQVNNAIHVLAGDTTFDGGGAITQNSGTAFFAGSFLATSAATTFFAEGNGTNAIDISSTPTNAIKTRAAASQFDVENAAASSLTFYNASAGVFRMALGVGAAPTAGPTFSPNPPTSVNHGALGAGSTDLAGNVTGVGANTSVTLTFSSPFPNHAWCTANANNTGPGGFQVILVQLDRSHPAFLCSEANAPANCDDFTYICIGQ
jgi:hypothetical protein